MESVYAIYTCLCDERMSQRWVDVSRALYGVKMHIPDLGVRLTVGTRVHRKFVLREFRSAGLTDEFYKLVFAKDPVHITFERCQTDLELAMVLFERHPGFLSWHMLMTNDIFVWRIVDHPPFAQQYAAVASIVRSRPSAR